MSQYFCYILRCQDGSFYTGWTTDPHRRLKEHAAGRGARYTRCRLPVVLAYVEAQPDRPTAMKRELALKALSRDRKRRLIGLDDAPEV